MVILILQGDFKGPPQFIMTQVMKRHPLAIRYIRRHFVKKKQQQEKAHRARHQPTQLERSTQAESDAILPPASLYEEPWPTSHFMRARSVTKGRSTSEPTVKKQFQELMHSTTQSEDLSKQSPPSSVSGTEFYTPKTSSASENTNIKTDCRVNSDMSAQTGSGPHSVDP